MLLPRLSLIALFWLSPLGCRHAVSDPPPADTGVPDAGPGSADASSSDGSAGGGIDSTTDASTRASDAAENACAKSRRGLDAPMTLCTPNTPCSQNGKTITTPIDVPVCRTTDAHHPSFDDGAPLHWTDIDGTDRWACLYRPTGATRDAPRPVLVFMHGSYGSASFVYDSTLLRAKATNADLGEAGRAGFYLLSIQGRNLHWPEADSKPDGATHDYLYQDFDVPSRNPDVANLDGAIDALVKDASVDPRRIFITGHSNGAYFAEAYGFARHTNATTGGHRVAAVAVYSGADPYRRLDSVPFCGYPHGNLPLLVAGRACDLVPCSAEQAAVNFGQGPSHSVDAWFEALRTDVADTVVQRRILAADGATVTACAQPGASCTAAIALVNHLHWPDGIADGGGHDLEPEMLAFLRAHPLF